MNLVITISGPTGAGKSHLACILSRSYGFGELVSVTTRPPRSGESNGVDYHFIDQDQFEALRSAGQLVESINYPAGSSNHYGVTRSAFEEHFSAGRPVVVVCEPNGAKQIQGYGSELGWQVESVYLDNPMQILMQRVLERLSRDLEASPGAWDAVMASYAERLASMHSEEVYWRNSCSWDLVVPLYVEQTTAAAVDSVLGLSQRLCRSAA